MTSISPLLVGSDLIPCLLSLEVSGRAWRDVSPHSSGDTRRLAPGWEPPASLLSHESGVLNSVASKLSAWDLIR